MTRRPLCWKRCRAAPLSCGATSSCCEPGQEDRGRSGRSGWSADDPGTVPVVRPRCRVLDHRRRHRAAVDGEMSKVRQLPGGGKAVELAPDRLSGWFERFGQRHGGIQRTELAERRVEVLAADGAVAAGTVPFEPLRS